MKRSPFISFIFSVLAFAFSVWQVRATLPEEYLQVEYIETTGSQYIDTGIVAGADVSAILGFTPLEYTGNVTMGTISGGDDFDWRFFNYSGGAIFDIGSKRLGLNSGNSPVLTLGTQYTIELGNAYFTIRNADDTVKWSRTDGTVSADNIASANIFVGANNDGSGPTAFTRLRIHSLAMSNRVDGVIALVRNFVPCVRQSDNVPGLYETVEDLFYPDSATSDTPLGVGDAVRPEILVQFATDLAYTNKAVRVSVVSRCTGSRDPIPARVVAFDGDDTYSFSKGVFTWVAPTAGVYTVTFETELYGETAQTSASFEIINPPEGVDTRIIYDANFVEGFWGSLAGTQYGLLTNQTDAVWMSGGGWYWSDVVADGDHVSLGEEKACAYLPVLNTNRFVRPATLTISATLSDWGFGNTHGVGFWSDPVPRTTYYPIEGSDEMEIRYYDSKSGYTGLLLNKREKTVQLAVNGSLVGTPASVDPSGEEYETLTYSIDTQTGALLDASLNGEAIVGLPATTAFTFAATRYAGVISWVSGRASFSKFSLTEGESTAIAPVITIGPRSITDFAGKPFSFSATALNPDTLEPIELVLESFDGTGPVSFEQGAFFWIPTQPGTYTATFRATIGSEVRTKNATLKVLPLTPIFDFDSLHLDGFLDASFATPISARNPDTNAALPVEVIAFDGPAFTYANDTFAWTSSTPGTYTATFQTSLVAPYGTEVLSTNIVFDTYAYPKPLQTCIPIYQTELQGADGILLAGTSWGDVEGRTSHGLIVNKPNAQWIWGTGYDWAIPRTSDGGTAINLGDELSCLLLPLSSTSTYTKPTKIRFKTTFKSVTGMCLAGFWSVHPYEATQNFLAVTHGFTGFCFNGYGHTIQLFANGTRQGSPIPVSFLHTDDGLTLSFLINTAKGTVDCVEWEGFYVGDFTLPAFTDEATTYAGVGVQGNGDNPISGTSRGRFSYLEISEPLPDCTLLLFR